MKISSRGEGGGKKLSLIERTYHHAGSSNREGSSWVAVQKKVSTFWAKETIQGYRGRAWSGTARGGTDSGRGGLVPYVSEKKLQERYRG